jgi:hypothetical protein
MGVVDRCHEILYDTHIRSSCVCIYAFTPCPCKLRSLCLDAYEHSVQCTRYVRSMFGVLRSPALQMCNKSCKTEETGRTDSVVYLDYVK